MIILDATVVNIALPHIQTGLHFSADQPVLGDERVHADVRRPPAARRPRRRHPRPPPDVPGRHRHLHPRLAGRRPRADRGACCSPPAPSRASAARSPRRPSSRWSSAASPRAGSGSGRSAIYSAVVTGGSSLGLVLGGMITQWVVLALGAVHQRARSASRSPIAHAAVRGRDAAAARPVRPAGRRHLDGRRRRARLRLHPGRVQRLGRPRRHRRVRGRRRAARRLRASTRPARRSRSRRCGCSPTPGRSGSFVARLLLVAGMFGMFFFLTQFLQDVLGFGPLTTGIAFLPMTVDAVRGVPARAAADPAVRRAAAHARRHAPGDHRDGLAVAGVAGDRLLVRGLRPDGAARRRHGRGVRAAHHGLARRGAAARTRVPPPAWSTSCSSSAAPWAWRSSSRCSARRPATRWRTRWPACPAAAFHTTSSRTACPRRSRLAAIFDVAAFVVIAVLLRARKPAVPDSPADLVRRDGRSPPRSATSGAQAARPEDPLDLRHNSKKYVTVASSAKGSWIVSDATASLTIQDLAR